MTRTRHYTRRPGARLSSPLLGPVMLALAMLLAAAPSASAQPTPPAKSPLTRPPVLADGQLVVKLTPGADLEAINRSIGSTTASVLLASRSIYLLSVPVHEVDGAKRSDVWKAQADRLVRTLERNPAIAYAEPNSAADSPDAERFHLWPSGPPICVGTDPSLFTDQQAALAQNLVAVHSVATGAGQLVAVIDSGVDLAHPSLAGHLAVGGYDYVDDDPRPDDAGDGPSSGHGTFVAGIVSLVAPDARVLPLRVLDPWGRGNVFVVAESIFDAVSAGAKVINMSFGTSDKLNSKVLAEALDAAAKAGVVVVSAAGNDGSSAQHFPAASAGVVSVAAMNGSDDGLASFSVRGAWVDLAAPGVDIVSTLPCGFGRWSGTSMAAPFVSGEAALIRQTMAKPKAADVIGRLLKGVVKVRGLGVHAGSIDIWRAVTRG